MTIAITPAQFNKLTAALHSAQEVRVSPLTARMGNIRTPDVDLRYRYDGVSSCEVDVVQRNSFKAHCASDAVIEDHIRRMFAMEIAL